MASNYSSPSSSPSLPTDQKRIMMLTLPRSLSTVFTKWFSSVFEDTLVFHELFVCAHGWGPEKLIDVSITPPGKFFQSLNEAWKEDVKAPAAIDVEQCTYGGLKELLEKDYPEKKYLFCKDFAFTFVGKEEMLPKGYRYCFLIRHPAKIIMSLRKLMARMSGTPEKEARLGKDLMDAQEIFYDSMFQMWQLVKDKHDPNAIILDADDLCNYPAPILSAFCKSMGIPFTEDLLQWTAGEDAVKDWVAVKMFILGNSMIGYYKNAFESTAFNKPSSAPIALLAEEQAMVDAMMSGYNKMYEARVKPE